MEFVGLDADEAAAGDLIVLRRSLVTWPKLPLPRAMKDNHLEEHLEEAVVHRREHQDQEERPFQEQHRRHHRQDNQHNQPGFQEPVVAMERRRLRLRLKHQHHTPDHSSYHLRYRPVAPGCDHRVLGPREPPSLPR
ncbi:hypothetical protein HG530_000293 [Fusarium avenaceum]|nr:hypothetical protein HG530_000293 [Fusarium avenaceum]